MKHITFRDNAVFEHLRALLDSMQHRRRAGQSVLDGVHLAAAHLDVGHMPAQCLVSERHIRHSEVAAVLDRVDLDTVILLADNLLGQLITTVNGVDLMALVEMPEGKLPQTIGANCVILNGTQDAGNVGSILRRAAAVGVCDAFTMLGCVFARSAKTLCAAMGAHSHLNIAEYCTFESVHSCLQVSLLDMSSHVKQAVFDVPLNIPAGWAFGNEGAGVSEERLSIVTILVMIPQPGGMGSLNAAVTAATCLLEAVRQCHAG